MQRHSDKCSTEDPVASLLSAARANYELIANYFMYVACKTYTPFWRILLK